MWLWVCDPRDTISHISCVHINIPRFACFTDNVSSYMLMPICVECRWNAASQHATSLTSRISWFATTALIKPLKSSMTCILQHGRYLQFFISLPTFFIFFFWIIRLYKHISGLNGNAPSIRHAFAVLVVFCLFFFFFSPFFIVFPSWRVVRWGGIYVRQ